MTVYTKILTPSSEAVSPIPLIAPWPSDVTAAIQKEFTSATTNLIKKYVGSPDWSTLKNQAKGNLIAKNFISLVAGAAMPSIRVRTCSGPGYPDQILVISIGGKQFSCALELKATAGWNSSDSNRRVLTSSSAKLRNQMAIGQLPSPPCHLIATVIYDDTSQKVKEMRFDFLGPDSEVNVRLEASTSHKLLAAGAHANFTI